jgi:Protein of unknown function (DUF4446)
MQSLLDALDAGAGVLAGLALLVAIVALVVAVMRRRRDPVVGQNPYTVDDPILDQLLASQMQRLDGVADELRAQGARIRAMEGVSRHAVQRVGLVRYNPYEDTGGNQSFALALLDADANGVVLTSLHSRNATRVYLRTIVAGRCDAALSAEEAEALRQAGVAIGG